MTKTARRWVTDAGIAALATGADLGISLARHPGYGQPASQPGVLALALVVVSVVIVWGGSAAGSPLEFDLLLLAGLVTLFSVAEASRALNARTAADRHG